MDISGGAEEGFLREWSPCTHILSLIPLRVQNGLFSSELNLTCVDAVPEYIALGTNLGLVYWYDRKKGTIQRLRCEVSSAAITFVKIANTVDYMVGAGNAVGQVTVFQIPKQHPENIPDTLKPKVEPKVERYTIGDLHKSAITSIEWSKNGMRLFSGDKNGVIVMTEIDFYMHLCKSSLVVQEAHEIVQLSYHRGVLLACSAYRSVLCRRRPPRWDVAQVGTRDRKRVEALGGVIAHSYEAGDEARVYCARPGLRLWQADLAGRVTHTLVFKDALASPRCAVELLNPAPSSPASSPAAPASLGRVLQYGERLLLAAGERALFVLDPRATTALAAVHHLRRVVSVCVCGTELWVVEGGRLLLRLAPAPGPAPAPPARADGALAALQRAVRALAPPPSPAAPAAPPAPAAARECVEVRVPPAGEEAGGPQLVHRHSGRRRAGEAPPAPRCSYTTPCLMDFSVYSDLPEEQSDEVLEQQIEEKEKILAKMLNLESLSMRGAAGAGEAHDEDAPADEKHLTETAEKLQHRANSPNKLQARPAELIIPKVLQLPNTWNLDNIQLKLDLKPEYKDSRSLASPEERLDNDWEIV